MTSKAFRSACRSSAGGSMTSACSEWRKRSSRRAVRKGRGRARLLDDADKPRPVRRGDGALLCPDATQQAAPTPSTVMPGLVPGIHVLYRRAEGRRGWGGQAPPPRCWLPDGDDNTIKKGAPMAYETIKYEVAEQILTITLNRPDKLNAFNGTMQQELIDAFDAADKDDDIRAFIVTGAGRGFCAGADLSSGADTFDRDAR